MFTRELGSRFTPPDATARSCIDRAPGNADVHSVDMTSFLSDFPSIGRAVNRTSSSPGSCSNEVAEKKWKEPISNAKGFFELSRWHNEFLSRISRRSFKNCWNWWDLCGTAREEQTEINPRLGDRTREKNKETACIWQFLPKWIGEGRTRSERWIRDPSAAHIQQGEERIDCLLRSLAGI